MPTQLSFNLAQVLYGLPIAVLLVAASLLMLGFSELANWMGLRWRTERPEAGDAATLAGASLGILALLLAFSFSIALARYDARRAAVLDEANAIGSAANFALTLPRRSQRPIVALLRQYAAVRVGLGRPYDPSKLNRDVVESAKIQERLWQRAVAVTDAAPQSLQSYRFVNAVNDLNNVAERRITTLRVRIPLEVVIMLFGTSLVAMGFVGFHAGLSGKGRILSRVLMAVTIAALIMLIVDLDRPSRGLISVSVQPLVDALQGISN
jgi:hypothetical protein